MEGAAGRRAAAATAAAPPEVPREFGEQLQQDVASLIDWGWLREGILACIQPPAMRPTAWQT